VAPDRDFELRQAAIASVRELSRRYDDIVPVDALREGFRFRGERISFGSFYSGIFRPRQLRGPAALTLTTTPPKMVRDAPYEDGYDEATGSFVYHYRPTERHAAGRARRRGRQPCATRRRRTCGTDHLLPRNRPGAVRASGAGVRNPRHL
jgi:hypothetical protein